MSPEHYFIKVVNRSLNRGIEVTHIWFDTTPQFHLDIGHHRRLGPDETYETWVPVEDLPDEPEVEWLARVRLSSGKIVKSVLNYDVPPFGLTAG